MSQHTPNPRKGVILSAGGFSLYACGDAITKHLGHAYDVNTIVFFITVIVVMVLLGLSLKIDGPKRVLRSRQMKWHLLRGVLLAFQALMMVYGFTHMSLAKTYAIVFSAPFYTTLLAALVLKEKTEAKKWLVMMLGFAGVLIILRPGVIPVDRASLSVVLSAFSFSVSSLLSGHTGRNGDTPLTMALLPEIVALVIFTPLFLLHPQIPSAHDLPWFLLLGALNAGGFLGVSLAFVYAPAALAAPFHYVQMLWGLTFGYFLFGDVPDRWTALGALIVIGAGLWLIRHSGVSTDPIPETTAAADMA